MAYHVLRFEKEYAVDAGADVPILVAIVKKDGQEQPFRIVVEHFSSAEDARDEVAKWIANQEKDEARGNEEATVMQKEIDIDNAVDELNS